MAAEPAVSHKRSRDDAPASGRRWHQLGPRITARQVLRSPAFAAWFRRPRQESGRGSGLLEPSNSQSSMLERQLLFDGADDAPFKGAAGYAPMRFDSLAMPDDIKDALIFVRDEVARNAFGVAWPQRVRPLSAQVTDMPSNADRGDHNDLRGQGTFIATYTASGSGDMRICYAEGEEAPPQSPRSKVNGKPQMVRRQDEGCYYSMEGASLADGTLHGVRAHAAGRISVTYRFELL